MMDKELREKQIDRFIQNEMEPDERTAFCSQMEADVRLREEVSLRLLLVEAEVRAAEKKAREAMEGIPTTVRRASRRNSWMRSACVATILVAAVFFGFSPRYTLYNVYETHYSIPSIERSRGGNGLMGSSRAFNEKVIFLYDLENYGEIVDIYKENRNEKWIDVLPVSTLLYIGVSLLEQKEAEEALSLLASHGEADYKEEVRWLLLAGYLQAGKRAEALRTAREIREEKGLYAGKAGEIEKALKEKKWF